MDTYRNHSLAPYTTVKIGGPADTFIITTTTDEFVQTLKNINKKLVILGNGSNTLISDTGIRDTVIKNTANKIEYLSDNTVRVESGVQLPFLINDTINHSLSGLEEFTYIPSTIGGAIHGNIHGVNKNNFDKFLVSIEIFDQNLKTRKSFLAKDLNWSYDHSEFQQHPEWVILSATLKLSPGDPATLKQTVTDITAKKITTQSMNSLGSTFKNPQNDFAGRIIDEELHLKGFRLGDAQISEKHANFILNLGHATASDYYALIKKIQSEAKEKGFLLEPEIKFLGDFS
ncbi:UDP-N-acetylmuramate dehydrogenase [Patescibacteria group bacterium]|nr:UDP-N-acetylmuramate dehydrogenase [Patescibacteria group bacterium]